MNAEKLNKQIVAARAISITLGVLLVGISLSWLILEIVKYSQYQSYVNNPSSKHNHLVLMTFTSDKCGACRTFKPALDEAVKELRNQGVDVQQVDETMFNKKVPGTNETYLQKYNVKAIPTVILLKDGVEVERLKDRTVEGVKNLVSKYQ